MITNSHDGFIEETKVPIVLVLGDEMGEGCAWSRPTCSIVILCSMYISLYKSLFSIIRVFLTLPHRHTSETTGGRSLYTTVTGRSLRLVFHLPALHMTTNSIFVHDLLSVLLTLYTNNLYFMTSFHIKPSADARILIISLDSRTAPTETELISTHPLFACPFVAV